MKINEEQLKQNLEELYRYYFNVMQKSANKPDDVELSFEELKAFGAVDAVGAIYLQCFGGKAMMSLWLENSQ